MEVNSVLGRVKVSELGVTLPHEHCHMEFNCVLQQPPKHVPSYPTRKEDTFLLRNLGKLRQYPYSSEYNIRMDDADTKSVMVDELRLFKEAGGGTIVENTVQGISRDVGFLKEIMKKSGVNVIAGTGYYVACSQTQSTLNLSQEQVHDVMLKELTEGTEGGVKCGVVGEIGVSWPMHDFEKRVIQAVAQIQQEVNPPISFHPGRHPESPFEIMRVFAEAGGKCEDVIMSHLDRTLLKKEELLEFAKLKTFTQFDLFGTEVSYYQLAENIDFLSDAQRIDKLKMLRDEGHLNQITVSHDLHTKHRLANFGGHGYSHILKNVVPQMRIKSFKEEEIDVILKHNPQRWLARGHF